MILYILRCPECKNIVQDNIDELKYIDKLVHEENIICEKCYKCFNADSDHFIAMKS